MKNFTMLLFVGMSTESANQSHARTGSWLGWHSTCYIWLISFVIVTELKSGRHAPRGGQRCAKWPIPWVRFTQPHNRSMKRTFTYTFAALGAGALFGGLVYAVLVAVHVSEPAAITVYG